MTETEIEITKQITDFPNYEISNLGVVKNTKTGRILKPSINKSGYYCVVLTKDKKKTTKKIHMLVATFFIENVENKNNVEHINKNKLDNRVHNLQWCSLQKTKNIRGVIFNENTNKWEAFLTIDKIISVSLGDFDNLNDAKFARIAKVHEVFNVPVPQNIFDMYHNTVE